MCRGINLGDTPRGLRHPRGVPSVDPSTLGRKTLYKLASLKYCYNILCSILPLQLGKERKMSFEIRLLKSLSVIVSVLFPPSFLLLSGQTIKPCCINGWAWLGPHYFPRAVKEKERAGIPMCFHWGNVASSPDKNAGFSLTMFSRMWAYSSIS